MASAANVQMDIFGQRRAGFDHITARTGSRDFFILRMDIGFHGFISRE
jgi:hypothetical protein